MNLPATGTLARTLIEFLFDKDGATLDEIKTAFEGVYQGKHIGVALPRNRREFGHTEKKEGVWYLSATGRRLVKNARGYKAEIVPPRTYVVNRPLSPQHFLKTTANRHDAMQSTGRGFLVSGTSTQPFFRGN